MNENLLETVPCGVCGFDGYLVLFEAKDYLYGNTGSWPVAQCHQCGVLFMNPRIPPSQIGPYYPATYYTTVPSQGRSSTLRRSVANTLLRTCWGYKIAERDPWWGRLLGYVMLPYIKRWSPATKYIRRSLEPQPRVLDVGCGSGASLTGYKRLGWITYGNEVDPDSAAMARSAGHEVMIGEVKDAAFPTAFFDAITLWDALEHIHNPASTMQELFRVTKPGGTVHISVPNAGSWYWRKLKDKWFMFTAPLHYYHYTETTLRFLLATSGFIDIRITRPLGDVGIRPTLRTMALEHTLSRWAMGSRLVNWILSLVEVVMPSGHLHATAKKAQEL